MLPNVCSLFHFIPEMKCNVSFIFEHYVISNIFQPKFNFGAEKLGEVKVLARNCVYGLKMERELDYLNTIAITGAYINVSFEDLHGLYNLLVKWVENDSMIQKLSNEQTINFLVMKFKIELITNELSKSKLTVARLKDLFGYLKLNEDNQSILRIILLKSEILEMESQGNNAAVTEYLDNAATLVVNKINNERVLNLNNANEKLLTLEDFYSVSKRKVVLENNSTDDIPLKISNFLKLLASRPLDLEVIYEVAELYFQMGKYRYSLFYINECLLNFANESWKVWCKRGEICQILSHCEPENRISWLLVAIKSFTYSIGLCENIPRSYCGLYVALQNLINSKNGRNDDLNNQTYEQMLEIVKKKLNLLKKDTFMITTKDIENIDWILSNK